MPTGVKVVQDDGDGNKSAEVWSAYAESPSLEPVASGGEGGSGDGGGLGPLNVDAANGEAAPSGPPARVRPTEPAQRSLPKEHVEYMISDPASWKLRIGVGEGDEVIGRDDLKKTWEDSEATGLAPHQLRGPTEGESDALAWDAANGPGGTDGLFKELAGAPAAVVGAVGSLIALAQADKANKDLLIAAVVVFGLAALVAAIGVARVRLVRIYPSRLDQLEQRYEKAKGTKLNRLRLPALLSTAGIVLVVLAFVVDDEPPAASADIGVVRVDRSSEALIPTVRIEWTNLPDDAKSVNTTITGGIDRDARDIQGGSVVQRIRLTLAKPGDIVVRTKALDGSGKQVGQGFDETLPVK